MLYLKLQVEQTDEQYICFTVLGRNRPVLVEYIFYNTPYIGELGFLARGFKVRMSSYSILKGKILASLSEFYNLMKKIIVSLIY